jgi:ribosome modulation factor
MITSDELKPAWNEGQLVSIEGESSRANPYGETMLGEAWLAGWNGLPLPKDTELRTWQDGAVSRGAA